MTDDLELDREIAMADAMADAYRAWRETVFDRDCEWVLNATEAFDGYDARELAAMDDADEVLRAGPDYRAYLKTELWKVRAARTKHWGICVRCGLLTRELDAHHTTYERLGFERPSDLVALCRRCHTLQGGRARQMVERH